MEAALSSPPLSIMQDSSASVANVSPTFRHYETARRVETRYGNPSAEERMQGIKKAHRLSVSLIKPPGNGCGHSPNTPRFPMLKNPYHDKTWDKSTDRDNFGHKRRAWFLYESDAILRDFYTSPKMLKRLGFIEKGDKSVQRRSCAREADVAVLMCLTHHTHYMKTEDDKLGAMRFGYPSKTGFVFYNVDFISKKTGLTLSRISRSLARLQAAGYITRTRRWEERESGKFKALTTATIVNVTLFAEMKLLQKVVAYAEFSYQKLKKEAVCLKISLSAMVNLPKKEPHGLTGIVKGRSMDETPDDYPVEDHRHYYFKLKTQKHREQYMRIRNDLFISDPDKHRKNVANLNAIAFKNVFQRA